MVEYSHAIQSLIGEFSPKEGNGPSADVCLIACVLFACFEVGLLWTKCAVLMADPGTVDYAGMLWVGNCTYEEWMCDIIVHELERFHSASATTI